MKTRAAIILIAFLYLTSCEKVVYVDLNTTDPKLVVEGNLSDQPGPYIISLTHSVNYYDPDIFPAVSGAHLVISDNAGNSETLTEVSPGKYQTNTLQGVTGRTYSLKISADGKQFDASSTMPSHVPIDSVNFQLNNNGNSYRVICKFKDPEGVQNFYKLQLSSNDTAGLDTTDVRILADGFADGQELSITYRTHLLPGDSVNVKLECIDNSIYTFYRTLADDEGGIRSFVSAPPANPVTNVSNGGFGYFSAYSVAIVSTVVH